MFKNIKYVGVQKKIVLAEGLFSYGMARYSVFSFSLLFWLFAFVCVCVLTEVGRNTEIEQCYKKYQISEKIFF